jgi:cyclopropane fatty-acyl-phospholipid synthase-like methyltransferase/short-subunit dehydrogenase
MLKQEKTTREKFNYLKKYYDGTWDKKGHTLHVGLFKSSRDSLEKSYQQATDYLIKNASSVVPITKTSTILDIGCGTGRTIVQICLKYNCHGVGLDLSDEQIKDAKSYLNQINLYRSKKKLSKVNVKFIRASGSDLDKTLNKNQQFTHIISQDAILLVTNKKRLFQNIYKFLAPGGVFAVVDFLSESTTNKRTESEENLIYKLVNWNKSLSFSTYNKIIEKVGLKIIKSEQRNTDMIQTYKKLAKKMESYTHNKDTTYTELKNRYQEIVSSVKSGKMGWGMFIAQKPPRKIALIAGTKPKSIGRFLAKYLYSMDWEIWLYSRHATKINKPYWHERKCDISKEKSVKKLLSEITDLDLVMMLADTGGEGSLEELSEDTVKGFINAKLVGTVLLNRLIALKFPKREKPIKTVWCAGKLSKKSKDLILYGMINSGLASYVEALNDNYEKIFEAYYLPTGLISPSTLGNKYIRKVGPSLKKIAQSPEIIVSTVKQILENKINPGMINTTKKLL